MTTRLKKNSWTKKTVFPILCCAFMCYFSIHAFSGNFGLTASKDLMREQQRLAGKLAIAQVERKKLARLVALYDSNRMDADMVEERARKILGMVHTEDMVLIY